MPFRISLIAAMLLIAAPAAAPAAEIDWTAHRVLNITHQGGEDEAPSGTIYALERSLRLGSDMLEVDIHTTADGHVIVMHDSKVDRTTDGTGRVSEMTLAEIQKLDAAHDFVPGIGTTTDATPHEYAFRGVATGKKAPPPGYARDDFGVPTLEHVLRRYSDIPINIEIKGNGDTDFESFFRNADHLAETLERVGRTEGLVVASFNDAALERFHQRMPGVDLAPALVETAAYRALPLTLLPDRVVLQVPITFSGLQVTSGNWVKAAHASGYGVHVWLSNDPENDDVYRDLLAWNVDGIMAAQPGALERLLCARGVARPPRPAAWPGRHCNHLRSSIACDVRPVAGTARGNGRIKVRLRRLDDFAGRCAGRVRVAGTGKGGRTRFSFGRMAPGEGGPAAVSEVLPVDFTRDRAVIHARPYGAFTRTRTLEVSP